MPITSKTVSKAVYLSPTFWLYCCLAGSLAIFKPYPTSCPQSNGQLELSQVQDGSGLDVYHLPGWAGFGPSTTALVNQKETGR